MKCTNGNYAYCKGKVEHTCVLSVNPSTGPINAKPEMAKLCEEFVLTNPEMNPKEIANEVMKMTIAKYDGVAFNYLTADQLLSMVHRVRTKGFGDWEGIITSLPMCNLVNDERLFLQANAYINIDNELVKFLVWAHPDLILLCKNGKRNLFIDCTFRCVPVGFDQLMIIMLYDLQTGMYVPIFFILMQTKKQDAYFYGIALAIQISEGKLDCLTYTCDFELALIQAIDNRFRGHKGIMCDFHWYYFIFNVIHK